MINPHWLAGVIDSSCFFCIQNNKSHYAPYVGITTLYKDLIENVEDLVGLGTIRECLNTKGRLYYKWEIKKRDTVKSFIDIIKPYLKIKNEHINLMLEFLETSKIENKNRRIAHQEVIKDELSKLNHGESRGLLELPS